MKIKHIVGSILMPLLCVALLFGCGKENNEKKVTATTTEQETQAAERYNTVDKVILLSVDTSNSTISVRGVGDTGKLYILNYNSGTGFKNKYDGDILISQLELGDILDVYYVAGTQKLIMAQACKDTWENDTVTVWDMDYDSRIMMIGGERYQYNDSTLIISGKKLIDIKQISGVDTLVVRGKDKQIYSISIKTGHGYIKLQDTANMVGGMVDIGGKIMTVITENMIIAAPEGEHTLWAAKDGKGGSTTVKVERDQEVYVSLSGFQGEIEKNGALNLNIYPSNVNCNIFVDGVEYTEEGVIDLSYGRHVLRITSDKYEDYVETIVINSIYTNKAVRLDGSTDTTEEEDTDSKETTSGSVIGETGTVANDNTVTVNNPEGASLYIDGDFVGIIPLTMEKKSGEHSAILRQTGYKSVYYNIEFSDDTANVSISFPSMEENEELTTD